MVERPTSVKLPQLDLHLDILDKELWLGAHPNGRTEDLSGGDDVESPDFKGGVRGPELGESELFVRDELDGGFVHVPGAFVIFRVDLLESGVLEPEVDVPPPEPLFARWRHVGHGPLVRLPHSTGSGPDAVFRLVSIATVGVLFQSSQREPGVIVGRVVSEFFFVLYSSFAQHGQFHASPIAVCPGRRRMEASVSIGISGAFQEWIVLTLFLKSGVGSVDYRHQMTL